MIVINKSRSLQDDEHNLLQEWNDTNKGYPLDQCLHELIEKQVSRNPDTEAVRFEKERLCYSELNDRSNQCGHYLRALGIGPNKIVGIVMERSMEMVIALLSILKSGGAYLPLDPSFPEERLNLILEDAGVSIVLTQKKHEGLLENFDGTVFKLDSHWGFLTKESKTNLETITSPNDLAYVIYTSGSTGTPKGCMISHKAICNRLIWMHEHYQVTDQDRILQKTPFTFDVSVWEFFLPLLSGACLVIAKPKGHQDNSYLIEKIRKEQVTFCHFVPSMLRFFLNQTTVTECDSLVHVFTSGEALSFDLVKKFKKKLSAKLHNLYGPTEAAVDVTFWECEERTDKKVPIGRPISNIRIYILNSELKQLPIGVTGELYIGGVGLAKGYLNRPELTEKKFVKNPFSEEPDSRLYRTGDKARYLPDGNIEFLGRIDFQVKLRGFRIELGEIQATLRKHEAIEDAIVVIKEEETEDPKLVAYTITKKEVASKQIKDFVGKSLPEYMVPNIIVPLDSMPVTQHGKTDRKSLPWPIQKRVKKEKDELTPTKNPQPSKLKSKITRQLLEYFTEILHSKDIKISDDLFDLGATSFTMVQVVEKIQGHYGVTIPVEVFLDDPTVGAIADYLLKQLNGMASVTSCAQQPEENQQRSEDVLHLLPVTFKTAAYTKSLAAPGYADRAISFTSISRLLSLLKLVNLKNKARYLYPSSGGMNAVQTYLYIKNNQVKGLGEGIYYYHPEKHGLYCINADSLLDRSIFLENDRALFDQAGFALFFIAQMEAIEPTYQIDSRRLVVLDAGYMGQLLLSRQLDCSLGMTPVVGVEFDRISSKFKLDESHQFIHCIIGGARTEAKQRTGERSATCYPALKAENSFTSFLKPKDYEVQLLTKEEQNSRHKQKVHLRRFAKEESIVNLEPYDFPESDYVRRSCQRTYFDGIVSFAQFCKLLSLLRSKNIEGVSRRLRASITATDYIRAYLYIKEDSVEGIAAGVYAYDPEEHALVLVTSGTLVDMKSSYTPFNRKHFKEAKFCLFLLADLKGLEAVYNHDSLYVALLEAGYIGELLTENKAEFEMGLCPVGGMRFEKIRAAFKLEDSQELVHSFFGGKTDQPLPVHRELLEMDRGELDQVEKPSNQVLPCDLAIVGVSGRYPGAENIETYWENLKQGKSNFSDWPMDRPGGLENLGIRGGFLKDVDCFDSLLFAISPAEARGMDPQERLFLEVAWECLETAGYTSAKLNRCSRRVGVFVGAMWNDYQNQGSDEWARTRVPEATSSHSSIANRVSFIFNFSGPSLALDTSCSSALTAIHIACESIKNGDCDAAIVGGINIINHPYHRALLTHLDLLSASNECHPFGAEANGWVVGEGVGAILIKSKEHAEKAGDTIHGLIKGTAINHSGKTMRYGAPNAQSQRESILRVLEKAGLSAESIRYVEAAAPGASIADASEMTAIKEVFQNVPGLLVGTVKSNIGHLESASGMSQLTKVLLQMKHGQLVPTLNFKPVNPLIKLDDSGLEIVDTLKPWNHPRRALINSFGATGSGGHIILEEYFPKKLSESAKPTLITLSAATKKQLKQMMERLHDFLTLSLPLPRLSDIGYTLRMGRVELEERLAIVVETHDELREKLDMYVSGTGKIPGLFQGRALQGKTPACGHEETNLFAIAEQWVRGASFDWKTIDKEGQQRIPLPTYPFAKEKYWVKPHKAVSHSDHDNGQHLQERLDANGLAKVEAELKKIFAEVSEIPVAKINAQTGLKQYGINSMMIKSLNLRLEKEFGALPKTLFFECPTLHELAKYFLEFHHDQLHPLWGIDSKLIGSVVPREKIKTPMMAEEHLANDQTAIIGIDGRFPKAANLIEYWENLKNGVDCISEIPPGRWDYLKYYNAEKQTPGKAYSKWGGFIDDVDKFDPPFFNMSSREAELTDPQERLFLETVWHTFEDAGYTRSSLKSVFNSKVGVFVGVMYGEYQLVGGSNHDEAPTLPVSATYGSIANRVSYMFDIHGPSMAIDTLCSSSLTALHLASESIRHGECEAAIAGGVNLSIHPTKYIQQAQIRMLSTDGRCRSFGEDGDGLVPGEGVGAVLLKPLDKAIADGDRVHGIIKATAVNHNGKTNGYTVPNPQAQTMIILDALKRAQVNPDSISYVEAHGTGTSLGDPVEIRGLNKAFGRYTERKQFCSIGSAKSNIGHLEAAAGMAALSKVLLQMKYQLLAPSLHVENLNRNIDFETSPFYVQQKLTGWKRPVVGMHGESKEYPRIACISSFGAGGSNAHVIIEEHLDEKLEMDGPYLIVLSARNEDRLKDAARNLLTFLASPHSPHPTPLHDVAYTLQVGREAMEERLGLLVHSLQKLKEKLQNFLEGKEDVEDLYRGQAKQSKDALAVFTADEEIQEAINKWIERKKHNKLLDLWVKGFVFDWNKLYGATMPRRISLPTYPFARKRFWIPEQPTTYPPSPVPRPQSPRLHPLIHENTSTLGKQRFSSTFTGKEFFLKDHQLKGEKILPGVAYLEMAAQALKLASSKISQDNSNQRLELKNVVWARPIIIGDNAQELHIELFPEENGEIAYEIYTDNPKQETEPFVHSQGVATLRSGFTTMSIDLADLQKKFIKNRLNRKEYDEALKAMGGDYGPAYKGFEMIYIADNDVLAKLSLPASITETLEEFTLHPSIIDFALKASIALHINNHQPPTTNHQLLVPYVLEHLEILDRCRELMWAWIRCSDGSKGTSHGQKWDIDLYDEQGNLRVKMLGLTQQECRLDSAPVGKKEAPAEAIETQSVWEFSLAKGNGIDSSNHPNFSPDEKAKLFIQQLIASQLNVSMDAVNMENTFMEVGLTSSDLMVITQSIKEKIAPNFPPALFFEYMTPLSLSRYLSQTYKPAFQQLHVLANDIQVNKTPQTSKTTIPVQVTPIMDHPVVELVPYSKKNGAWPSRHKLGPHTGAGMEAPPSSRPLVDDYVLNTIPIPDNGTIPDTNPEQVEALLLEIIQSKFSIWVENRCLRFRSYRKELPFELKEKIEGNTKRLSAYIGDKKYMPVSSSQERYWTLSLLQPDKAAYNCPLAIRFRGKIDRAILEKSFVDVVNRNQQFRALFPIIQNKVVQCVSPRIEGIAALSVKRVDLSHYDEDDQQNELNRLMVKEAQNPINPIAGPILRMQQIILDAEDYMVILSFHHTGIDGYSLKPLLETWKELYSSYANGNTPIEPNGYADYEWQVLKGMEGVDLTHAYPYWIKTLKGAPPYLKLPTDFPRPEVNRYCGDTQNQMISQNDWVAFKQSLEPHNITPYVGLLSILKLILYKWTGQKDIVIGATAQLRDTNLQLYQMIGDFTNFIPIRSQIRPTLSCLEFIKAEGFCVYESLNHKQLPFVDMIELATETYSNLNPIYNVLALQQDAVKEEIFWSESVALEISDLRVLNKSSMLDLRIEWGESPTGLWLLMEYNTDIFRKDTISQLLANIKTGVLNLDLNLSIADYLALIPQLKQKELKNHSINEGKEQRAVNKNALIKKIFEPNFTFTNGQNRQDQLSISKSIIGEKKQEFSPDRTRALNEETYKKILEDIHKYCAEILAVSPEDIDTKASFSDLGFQSVNVIQLASFLDNIYQGISATELFQYPNVTQLADYLASR